MGGELWHNWQRRGGDWAGWHSLEKPPAHGLTGASRLAQNKDGRLELFTKMTDGTLWHRWQREPGQGPWRKWHPLGTPGEHQFATDAIPPMVASNSDGRLELFVQADDGSIWHRWQTAPNGGWSDWSSFDAPGPSSPGEPVVARNQDGRLDLFIAVADGNMWHCRQAAPGSDQWEPWSPMYGPYNTDSNRMAAGVHADGRLVLFVVATAEEGDREVWQLRQTAPNAAWTQEWKLVGRPIEFSPPLETLAYVEWPSLGEDSQGRLVLFALAPFENDRERSLFYILQQATPSGDEWLKGVLAFHFPPNYTPQPAGEHPS